MTILVTGATGVIGTVVTRSFPPQSLTLLSRQPFEHPCQHCMVGHISEADFGWESNVYRRLAASTSLVIHIAGEVSFSETADHYHAVNVGGTTNIVRFCENSGARLLYVSTAYASRAGESSFVNRGEGPSAYTASKRAAEQVVESLGDQAAIVRPSVVLGDSKTGEILRPQAAHQILRSLLRGHLPLVPAESDWLLDTVPVDILAEFIFASAEQWRGGEILWATAGRDAWSAGQLSEAITRNAEGTGFLHAPRFFHPEVFDRLIRPVFYPEIPEEFRVKLDKVAAICDHFFKTGEPFPSDISVVLPHHDVDIVTARAWQANIQNVAEDIRNRLLMKGMRGRSDEKGVMNESA